MEYADPEAQNDLSIESLDWFKDSGNTSQVLDFNTSSSSQTTEPYEASTPSQTDPVMEDPDESHTTSLSKVSNKSQAGSSRKTIKMESESDSDSDSITQSTYSEPPKSMAAVVSRDEAAPKKSAGRLKSYKSFKFTGSDAVIVSEIDRKQLELSENIHALQDKIKTRDDHIKKMERDRKNLISDYEKKLEKLEENVKESDYKIKDLRKTQKKLSKEYESSLQERQNKLEEVEKEYDMIKSTTSQVISDLNSKIERLEQQMKGRNEELIRMESNHRKVTNDYESENTMLKSHVAELEDMCETASDEVTALRQKLEETEFQHNEYVAKLQASQQMIAREQMQKAEAEAMLQYSSQSIQQIQAENETTKLQLQRKYKDLKDKVAEKSQELEDLQTSQKKLKDEVTEVQEKLEDAVKRLEIAQAYNQEKDEKIRNYETELEELIQTLESERVMADVIERKFEELLDRQEHMVPGTRRATLASIRQDMLDAQPELTHMGTDARRATMYEMGTDARRLTMFEKPLLSHMGTDARRATIAALREDLLDHNHTGAEGRRATLKNGIHFDTHDHHHDHMGAGGRRGTIRESLGASKRRGTLREDIFHEPEYPRSRAQNLAFQAEQHHRELEDELFHAKTRAMACHSGSTSTVELFGMFNQLLNTVLQLQNAKTNTPEGNERVASEIHALTHILTTMAARNGPGQHSELPGIQRHYEDMVHTMKRDYEQRLKTLEDKLSEAERNRCEANSKAQLVNHLKQQIDDMKQVMEQMTKKEIQLHQEQDKTHSLMSELRDKIRKLERERDDALHTKKDNQTTIDCLKQQLEKKALELNELQRAHQQSLRKIDDLTAELDRNKGFSQQMELKLVAQSQDTGTEKREMEGRIRSVENVLDSLKREKDSMEDRHRQEIKNLQRDHDHHIATLTNEIRALTSEAKTAKKELRRLERCKDKEIGSLEVELNNTIEYHQKMKQNTSYEIEQCRNKINSLENYKDDMCWKMNLCKMDKKMMCWVPPPCAVKNLNVPENPPTTDDL